MTDIRKETENLGILEPQERLRVLTNYSNTVDIDPNVPPKRYYRSGLEMVRMANVYLEEGNLENAYVLYMKFMTLFIEKIRKHPEYATVPANVKSINQMKLREVLPKTEKLKVRLVEQYSKEYNRFIAEMKQRQLNEQMQRLKDEQKKNTRSKSNAKDNSWAEAKSSLVQPVPDLESISYPDPCAPSAPPEYSLPDTKPSCTPSIDRGTKPSGTTLAGSGSFSRSGLRIVVVPGKVMTHFLSLSQKSTFSNIETCGILAGKLEKNQLIITHMILPKQEGTADSCTTMNEEEIFDYQDQHNLITIGWIHSHPTQTAFLSSVDLHTHCPYQLLMPEAIAIVCAPKYEETGFFILTPSYGLQYVANCRKSGFHPHPTDPPLFMSAEHVKVDAYSPLEVLDLR